MKFKSILKFIIILIISNISWTSIFAQADKILVKGRTVDSNGQPLVGLTVVVKGTTNGVTTDLNGDFSIQVSSKEEILQFSYVGFLTEEIQVGDNTRMDVIMIEDIKNIDQVVVIGYGTVKKRDLTGAVSSITEEEIRQIPTTSVDQLLQGKAAGVNVLNTSGIPGKKPTVLIGGVGTVNNNEPLYVIDGFPTKEGIIDLNPNDIVSIDILKDASASAIYGARGANGVIMITTRRGKSGKPMVNFDSYYGIQQPVNLYEMLGKNDFVSLYNESKEYEKGKGNSDLYYYTRKGLDPFTDYVEGDTVPWEVMPSVDYVDAMFRNAATRNVQLSVTGGSENNQFAISAGYLKQDGVFIGTGFDRMNFRANTDNSITKFLKIGNSLNISRSHSQNVLKTGNSGSFNADEGYFATEILEQALQRAPYYPIYDKNGNYSIAQFPNAITNPVGNALRFEDNNYKTSLLLSGYAELILFKGLTYKLNAGINNAISTSRRYEPVYVESNGGRSEALVQEGSLTRFGWLVENTLNYQNIFADVHNVSALIGTSAQDESSRNFSAQKQNFPHPGLQQLSAASGIADAFGGYGERSTLSLFGRINYSFKDKYLFSATIRRDGSSKFGPDNRFGTFPSFAAAWRISKEDFIGLPEYVSDLKIRYGYGQIGNDEISNFIYLSTLTDVLYVNGNDLVAGIVPNKVPNTEVQWESTISQNLGLDLSLWNNQLLLTLDFYKRVTKDMLLSSPIPTTSGFSSITSNMGGVENKGINLTASYRKAFANLSYGISGNVSLNRNKITALTKQDAGFISYGGITRSEVDHPIAAFYGYIMEGIFQDSVEIRNHAYQDPKTAPGDVKYKDLNGDNRITEKDQDFLGSPWPVLVYGANAEASYKSISLNISIQGVTGNEIYNSSDVLIMGMNTTTNSHVRTLDRWRAPVYQNTQTGEKFVLNRDKFNPADPGLQMIDPGNPSNEIPRAIFGDPANNRRVSTRYIENGSYLRISNLSLSYSVPERLCTTVGFSGLRIYFKVNNLHVFSKFKGMDPEVGTNPGGNILSTGIYYNNVPTPRIYMTGLNITL